MNVTKIFFNQFRIIKMSNNSFLNFTLPHTGQNSFAVSDDNDIR